MSYTSQRPRLPAYYIEDCRIVKLLQQQQQQALVIQHAALLKVPLKPCTVLDLSTVILFKGPGMFCEAASWRSNRCKDICSVNLL